MVAIIRFSQSQGAINRSQEKGNLTQRTTNESGLLVYSEAIFYYICTEQLECGEK